MITISRLTPYLLAASLLAVSAPVFGAEGAPAKKSAEAKAPKSGGIKFSKARGFQSAPFDLVLGPAEAPGEIRYTLDGSAPSAKNGSKYAGPIPIRGTTVVRAAVIGADGKASRPQTATYLFTPDVIRQSPDGLPPAGWPYRWGENAVDYGMDPAVVDDPKYAKAIEPALKSLPTYSLVLDLADLFDERRGIYANGGQEGRDWERVGSLELIRPGGGKGFQEECGVRIRGGFSSGPFNPKHAFRLFFRKEYGAGKLKFPVFGSGGAQEFDSFDLRCAQNYSWNIGNDVRGLFLRDQFSRDTQRAMGQPAARGDYCHLYLNGQYWGLYATCERPEASFGEAHLGGAKEDYDVVKTGGIGGRGGGMTVDVTDGSFEPWRRLCELAKADLSDNANYFKLLGRKADGTPDPSQEVLLDPANLVDYLLVIWYGGNIDAPVSRFGGNRAPNNWHAMRNRKSRDGFKFFIWDAEHTLLDVEEDRLGPFRGGDNPEGSSPQWLFQQCSANAEFRVLLADRIQKHLGDGGVLSVASAVERFLRRAKEIEEAVVCESARWGDSGGSFPFGGSGPDGGRKMRVGPDGEPKPMPRTRDGEWRAEVNRVSKDYLPKRSDILRFQLWRQGFIPDVEPPQVGRTENGAVIGGRPDAEVWMTVDGTDPRRVGGEPASTAKRVGEGPGAATPGNAVIMARTRYKGDWSALVTVPTGAGAK